MRFQRGLSNQAKKTKLVLEKCDEVYKGKKKNLSSQTTDCRTKL